MTIALTVVGCVVAYFLMGIITHGISEGFEDEISAPVNRDPCPTVVFLWPMILGIYLFGYMVFIFTPLTRVFRWLISAVDLFGFLHNNIGRSIGRHMARMRDKAFYPERKSPEESKSAV